MPVQVSNETSFPNTIIRASAGTGKTFQLSNRYLKLLVDGVNPESILASTFTRKASGEILDRIIQRLARAANSSTESQSLAGELGLETLPQSQARPLLVRLLHRLHLLQISTLDSYFSKLARRHCLELGLSPQWSIVQSARDIWLREEAARRILSDGRASELIYLLAKGESRRSIIQLIDDTLDALYEIYQDAVETAWSNLPQLDPVPPGELASILEDLQALELNKTLAKAREGNLGAFEVEDYDRFFENGLAKALSQGKEVFNRSEIPTEVKTAYLKLFDHIAAVKLREHGARLEGAKALLDAFDDEYQSLKLGENTLRFSDVTRLLDSALAKANPRFDPLSSEQPVQHLLLDEFQDTSPIQWRILQPVAKQITATPKGSLLCVGDIKQAIYGWRGGVAEILDEVQQDLNGEVVVDHLVKSYRSSPVIMEVVNQVFSRLDRHPKLGDDPGLLRWQGRFEPHESALPDQKGHAKVFCSADPFAFVADCLAQDLRRYENLTCGVLVRTNNDVGRMMDELTRRGVPASEESGKSIADSPAVRVILSAMKWLDYPGDSVARFHVARSALGDSWGLESESIPFPRSENEAIAEALRGSLLQDGYGVTVERWVCSLLPGFDDRERQRLHQLVDLAYLFDRQKTIRPYDFVRYITHQKVSDPTSSNIRVMNIHQAKGLEFDVVYLPDLEGKMAGQEPPFVTERPRPTERVSAVSPYLKQSLQAIMPPPLPERVRHWKSQQISESLCRFYVAMTRAARALYFVTQAPKSNTGNLTQTWSGLVMATLNDGRVMEDGESGCEWGDADWYEQGQFPPIVEPESTCLQARPLKFSTGETQASRLIRSTSPSAQEGGGNVEVAQVLRRGATQAMLRGTAVHAIFEQIKWREREVDEKTILNWLAAFALPVKERQELAEQIGQLLRSDTAMGIMDESQYRLWLKAKWNKLSHVEMSLDVQTEYEFATIMDQQMWRGAIDRLVWVRSESKLEAADIIDFKTDRVESSDGLVLQERVAYYRPQLEAYRRALSKMTCLPESQISTRLWFVQTNEIVEV